MLVDTKLAFQTDSAPFNRAMLLNIGFVEATQDEAWQCCIFHDVDLIPEDDRWISLGAGRGAR